MAYVSKTHIADPPTLLRFDPRGARARLRVPAVVAAVVVRTASSRTAPCTYRGIPFRSPRVRAHARLVGGIVPRD